MAAAAGNFGWFGGSPMFFGGGGGGASRFRLAAAAGFGVYFLPFLRVGLNSYLL